MSVTTAGSSSPVAKVRPRRERPFFPALDAEVFHQGLLAHEATRCGGGCGPGTHGTYGIGLRTESPSDSRTRRRRLAACASPPPPDVRIQPGGAARLVVEQPTALAAALQVLRDQGDDLCGRVARRGFRGRPPQGDPGPSARGNPRGSAISFFAAATQDLSSRSSKAAGTLRGAGHPGAAPRPGLPLGFSATPRVFPRPIPGYP